MTDAPPPTNDELDSLMIPGATTGDRLPSLLTVDEAAKYLRLNRKTLYEAVNRKEVPGAVRFGKTIRISRDALLAYLRKTGLLEVMRARNVTP